MSTDMELAGTSVLYRLEYLTADGWVQGHHGVRLLRPAAYVERLAKNGKVGRATALDDRLRPTGEVYEPDEIPDAARMRPTTLGNPAIPAVSADPAGTCGGCGSTDHTNWECLL